MHGRVSFITLTTKISEPDPAPDMDHIFSTASAAMPLGHTAMALLVFSNKDFLSASLPKRR
ncbi:MAG: hypothetical protein AB7D42_04500 [Candidatus Methanomethylophilaceae archaeon]